MKMHNDIGKRIKALRKEKGLSQAEFAKAVGISQPHLSRVENGYENISKSVQELIAIRFSLTVGGDKQ